MDNVEREYVFTTGFVICLLNNTFRSLDTSIDAVYLNEDAQCYIKISI